MYFYFVSRYVNDAPSRYSNATMKRYSTRDNVFIALFALTGIEEGREIRYIFISCLFYVHPIMTFSANNLVYKYISCLFYVFLICTFEYSKKPTSKSLYIYI